MLSVITAMIKLSQQLGNGHPLSFRKDAMDLYSVTETAPVYIDIHEKQVSDGSAWRAGDRSQPASRSGGREVRG